MKLRRNQKTMPRGGKRIGAGAKPKWKHGKTKSIRVPEVLADEILRLAKQLDENGYIETDTESKTVNLSGIAIAQFRGKKVVSLENLAKAGYEILPSSLAGTVIDELYRKQLTQANKLNL